MNNSSRDKERFWIHLFDQIYTLSYVYGDWQIYCVASVLRACIHVERSETDLRSVAEIVSLFEQAHGIDDSVNIESHWLLNNEAIYVLSTSLHNA